MFKGRLLYAQVVFVVIAFAIMVAACYVFGQSRERAHISSEVENMFINIEEQLAGDLQELKTMLGFISETIKMKLLQDAGFDEIKEYINSITDYGKRESDVKGFVSVFGMFDVFDGEGYNAQTPDFDWFNHPGWDPTTRPWYIAANEANGVIAGTNPYEDTTSGEIVFTYARALYSDDEKTNRLGIICIDVSIDRLYDFTSQISSESVSYWMLFDSEMNFIAHPHREFLGMNLHELGNEHAAIADTMAKENVITGFRLRSYLGEMQLMSGRQLKLDNGWHMGIATTMDSYYRNLRSTILYLGSLGAFLSAVLSFILIRLVASRNRAEDRMRVMLDASPLCIDTWDKNYNLIDCNKTIIKFFGMKDKQELMSRIDEVIPEFQPDGMSSLEKKNKLIQKALDEGYCKTEWMNQMPDGEPAPADTTLVRVKYRNDYVVVAYMRDLREEKKMAKKVAEHGLLLSTVNSVASALLSINVEESFDETILEGMGFIGNCVNADRVHIWRNAESDDTREIIHNYEWLNDYARIMHDENDIPRIPIGMGIPFEAFPMWESIFRRGECIHGPVSALPQDVHDFFHTFKIKSVIVIPLYMRGRFWGMFTIDNCRNERSFSDEEISILQSAGLMMMHALNRSEMLEKFNEEHDKTEELAHWYHSILDEIPLPISVTDENMKWTFVNRAVENFLGMKRKDLIGWECSTWGSEICNTHRCGVACLKRGEKQTLFNYNGLSLMKNVEMLRDLNGETAGYIEVVQDITEIEALAKRQAETEAASNAKSAFLATVSHEIRTPMNTILGIAEIQLQNEKHPPEVDEAFNLICDSGDLLLNIINDILDVSKIEAGKLDIIPVRYDIPSLINDNAQLNYLRYESKPIKFKIILDPDTPLEFYGDEFRIKQVLNNLLSNAFKYTDTGEVELSVSAAPIVTNNESEAEKFDTALIIKVKDTGIGMTQEQVNVLFDEFTRFTEKRAAVGTGLGMSITKRLLDMMNGTVKVESEPDKGSTFTITLPQKRIGEDMCGDELVEKFKNFNFKSRARLKKAQIIREYMPYGSVLIVDDVSLNLQVAKGMMLPYSLKIETVMSGIEAIEMIKAGRKYDIIFMDHMMPVMNGIEATKIIRGLGYNEPVVALTANALAGQEEMFLRNNFDGFISKPIDSRELNVILNDFIRNRKPREIVEAARREQSEKEKADTSYTAAANGKLSIPDIGKYFAKDAESAVRTLESLLPVINSNMANDDDMELYVTIIHGMKSSLANIGERELSEAAYKLEMAGKERSTGFITDKTPVFVTVLKSLIEKFKPEESSVAAEITAEDKVYLREKLDGIKTACKRLDKKSAKEFLGEARERIWTEELNVALDDIDTHLLHSAFKKAAAVAGEAAGLL